MLILNNSSRAYKVQFLVENYIRNAVKNIDLEEDIVNPHNAVASVLVAIRVTHQPRSNRLPPSSSPLPRLRLPTVICEALFPLPDPGLREWYCHQ